MIALVRLVTLLCASALLASAPTAQVVWHVDDDAAPGGNGLGWATAFDSLDSALAAAAPFDSIWVAEGLYRPSVPQDPSDPRTATFLVQEARSLYGGFAGHETALDDRAGSAERTVLCGDLGVVGERSDNAYHVVHVRHPSGIPAGKVTIDGFLIRRGNADGPSPDFAGGGIWMFNQGLVLRHVTLRENRAVLGGAMHAQPAWVNMAWCRFVDNEASSQGGALVGQATRIFAHGCVFARNRSTFRGGVATLISMASTDSAIFESCVFHDNQSARGGVLFINGGKFGSGKATMGNCTLVFNRATREGGALWTEPDATQPAKLRLANSIVWHNDAPSFPALRGRAAVVHSNVQGGLFTAQGNLSLPPLFRDAASRDLRLAPGSPGVDAGHNSWIAPDLMDLDGDGNQVEPTPFDADGRPRRSDDPLVPDTGVGAAPLIDLGAFERPGT